MIINFKKFFIKSKVGTTLWEKAGGLNDSDALADINVRKKVEINYSRQDRMSWHSFGRIKAI